MICEQSGCGCALTVASGTITGSGTPADPWVLNVANSPSITQLQIDVANIFAALDSLPGTYVNITGDSMTGELAISNPSGRQLRLIDAASGTPFLDFRDGAGTRIGYMQGRATAGALPGLKLNSDNGDPIRLSNSGNETVLISVAQVLFYKAASGITTLGQEIRADGTFWSTKTDVNAAYVANKTGTGVVSATSYCDFRLSNTQIGSITRNAATSAVLFNTTSDADLKTVIDDLDPELAEYVLALLTPVMFTWNDDETDTPIVGYIAQQVAKAWPQAVELGLVTPGDGDVSDRTWDTDGNETTPEGAWRPWMMDKSVLIPLLHASLVRTTTRLSYLRAEHDELQAKYEALEARVAALEK